MLQVYLGLAMDGGTAPPTKHAGSFADFNVWQRPLAKEELTLWTKGER